MADRDNFVQFNYKHLNEEVRSFGPNMHSLEAACNEAQNLINRIELHGLSGLASNSKSNQIGLTAVPGPSWSTSPYNQSLLETSRKQRVYNIHQKLRDLYLEERKNTDLYSNAPLILRRNLKRGSKLLDKLVRRDNLNTLIVNLYPGNKGYSLSLRLQGKVPAALGSQAGRSQGSEPVVETMRWPYSDEELLRCIDREEIPAHLVDLLEENHSDLFYQGCIIAEVRDYRLTFPLFTFETHHVLLKPTTQSIINDVNVISSSQDFSAEERLSLESQIVLATAPPLCLDPNPAIGIMLNNLNHKRLRFSTALLRRTAKKFSQVTVNRKRKLDQFTNHNTLQLYDFISRRKAKLRATGQGKQTKKTFEGLPAAPPPVPSEETAHLQPPSVEPDVFKYAKHYEKPRETTDCSVQLIEEYILETERGQGRIYRIKLTILQRHSNLEYLGELYVDRDYKEGERSGASCRFVLGTKVHVNRYIQQFTEIFTEEGRKSVRITHVIPGQQHRVSYTPGMRERQTAQNLAKVDRSKLVQTVPAATQGKALNSSQNSNSQSINVQSMLSNSQHISLPTSQIEISPSGTINFNLNSQQLQKIQGQLNSTSTNVLAQNSNPNSTIQINSVSHLTSLLTNSNVAAPPNVNVHQIQQSQNVIGIASQSVSALNQQGRNIGQSVVNVQNIGVSSQNIGNSIQSLLTNALNSNTLGEDSVSNLQNGPISSGSCITQNTVNNSSNATVHHPPSQTQVPATKASRSSLATNPAISALVTSLMNSAQQFQVQQAAQQAANNSSNSTVSPLSTNFTQTSTSSSSQNPTILSLLNASTPLSSSISNNNVSGNSVTSANSTSTNGSNNVISTTNVNLSQQSQKLLSRKTITNLLNSRLLNQNLSATVNSSGNNPTLVVNNANQQPLRVTISSLNQLMNAANQNTGSASPQILSLSSVSNSSGSTGFTVSSPQGSKTLTTQGNNLTTQSFTLSSANSPTLTITTQNAQNQAYSLSAPAIGGLAQTQNHTITLAPNTGGMSPQSFTLSPASSNALASAGLSITSANTLSNKDFTAQSAQNSGSQTQTFTVLQPNQSLGSQSFTITAPVVTVGTQGFTVTNSQGAAGNQAFTITTGSVSPVSNKTYQMNNANSTNHTFTISTPIVTVANHFVNSQSSSDTNFTGQSLSQKFLVNSPTSQTSTNNVFTVSSVPNQVFTVNIPSSVSSHSANFNTNFPSSNTSSQTKSLSNQSSVLINKNQAFTINTNNQNFASLISNNQNINNLTKNVDSVLSSNSNSSATSNENCISNLNKAVGNNSSVISRNSAGKGAATQRRPPNALQITQTSELNKLLSERSDTILLSESNTLFNENSDNILNENSKLHQMANEKKSVNENSKFPQSLGGTVEGGTNSPGSSVGHNYSSSSNLGLSMPGLSALLAGTPSADNPIPGASNSSTLLERLTSSTPNPAFTSPPLQATPQSPNQNLNFQNSTYATSSSFNSNNSNCPVSTVACSSVPSFTNSASKNQMQFQSPSPNSKDILGISSPLSSPPGSGPVSLNLQGLSLQGIPGLQNVQVSIPGLAVPISLSLNVAGQPGNTQSVIMTSLPLAPTTNTNTNTTSTSTMILANASSSTSAGNILSLPVAPLMPQGTKSGNQRTTSVSAAQGNSQSIQLVSSLQRPCRSSINQIQGSKSIQSISSKGILNAQKSAMKTAVNTQISGSLATAGLGNQVLTLTAQQQLQLALQKQAQIQQCYNQQNQKRPLSPSSVANKHRRRSNTAESNK